MIKKTPFNDVDEVLTYVDEFQGRPEELELAISDALQDPIGMNMALITDKILKKGWEPDGLEEKDGYRVYRYKEME
jgi:hypothetical protein